VERVCISVSVLLVKTDNIEQGISEPFERFYECTECSQKDKRVLWILGYEMYTKQDGEYLWNKDENKDFTASWN